MWLTTMILAAGRGTRMGGPKALMTVGGEPWWRVQQRRLIGAGMSAFWVASADVAEAMYAEPDGPPTVALAASDAPMFTSLLVGLDHAANSTTRLTGLFVLPVHVPAPSNPTFLGLAEAGGPDGVAIPSFEGKAGHPVYLGWNWVERELLPRKTDDPGRLDELIRPIAKTVAVLDRTVVINLNTPDDLAAWEASRHVRRR